MDSLFLWRKRSQFSLRLGHVIPHFGRPRDPALCSSFRRLRLAAHDGLPFSYGTQSTPRLPFFSPPTSHHPHLYILPSFPRCLVLSLRTGNNSSKMVALRHGSYRRYDGRFTSSCPGGDGSYHRPCLVSPILAGRPRTTIPSRTGAAMVKKSHHLATPSGRC